jgi:ribosomal protein L35
MKNKKIKMKIRKSIIRRFKITKKGKVLRGSTHTRHLRRKKTKSRIRRLKQQKQLTGRLAIKIKKILGKKV